ncbi:tRNA uridine-5-carboxymethylaminomethyl(34) synthesis GTPase MnmE [Nemorincola caseinilytica]|uniref:tRNA modification GTPase MnmE n=1 Tax=Nemorincola caseinilytica TaxID=2054315 RepID=A0ABP8NJF6_9BACT
MYHNSDTIVAIATPPGEGAIGIIRLSGTRAIEIVASIFHGKDLTIQPTHTLHFGRIMDAEVAVDEVVVSLYRAPRSYTGEEVAEISCHGSAYILQKVVTLCVGAGARPAQAGEFTMRAFLAGKLDLTQAEAVADLIASNSSSAHKAAMHNLRGGFSHDLAAMREQLIQFAALIELELDFSQEDVEFADRTQFYALIERITAAAQQLAASFSLGNAIKNGVSVAIAGKPNAGKSTLLNALLNEERAIVSDIAGTTRDTIEELLNINGIVFRLIDTAGIRAHTTDAIEQQGIARSRDAMKKADIVIYLFDVAEWLTSDYVRTELLRQTEELQRLGITHLLVGNKVDEAAPGAAEEVQRLTGEEVILLSARDKDNIQGLKDALYTHVAGGKVKHEGTIVTNARHYAALEEMLRSLSDIKNGMDNNLPGDLLAPDIRRCLHYLGEITGTVTTEDMLDHIFSKFCIGK